MTTEEKLQSLIIKYKKHDKQRNTYYAKKMERLGELETFVQELEDTNNLNDVVMTIKHLKIHNSKLKEEITKLRKELAIVRQLLNPETSHLYKNLTNLQRKLINRILELESSVENYKIQLDKAQKLSNEYLSNLIKLQTK